MKSKGWLALKPLNTVILGCVWVSAVQCTVLSSCLASCVTNLGRPLDIGTPYNLSEACIQGCQFWNSQDQEKCALKCNDTYATICERESCEIGCSTAEGTYEEEVLESTEFPTAPFASSIGSHSVTLRWNPANISGVKYIIQWKYDQLPGSWTYTETVPKLSYVVEPLHPFTEYIFRVVWIFTAQLHLYSPPSPSYRTHPYGVPETAPFIMKIESSSPDTVEVSWAPPHFPGGPVLGYNLRLISKNQKLDSGTQRTSFQFYSTLPNTTYRFSIAAVNEVGEGPEAESIITTPSPAVQEEEQWLFLSRKTSLRKRSLKYLVDEAHCLWSDTIHHNITGIAVDVQQQVVYFSEGTVIWMKKAANMSDMSDLRAFYGGSGVISSISIDWLYRRMYFIIDKLVYVCDLENCSNFEEITPLSIVAPQKVVVDSYNGYVFYLLRDGIYRVSLPLPSGRHTEAVHIVESSTLKDFAVKPQSKRIIYFNDTVQVFMSTFLDGSAFHQVLPWVPLKDVKSFACENNDFLITDGKAIFQQDSLSFNEFIVGCDLSHIEEFGFGNLVIFGSSIQSYPLPGHPQELSVLFGSQEALVQWKPPALAIGASPSAWQNWTYEVKVSTQDLPQVTQVFSNLSGTMLNVPELQSATKYMVSVRASSPKGPGPWSDPSVGTTLVPATEPPFIMAVKEDGLWSKPLSSFGPGEFLSSDVGNVSDMDWYNNSLYYSDTKGNVYVRPLNGMDASENYHIPSIAGAGALAFEWLGHFLYWAGKTYVIQRQSVLTGHTDIVAHVKLLVNDMAVDSVGGYLYWTTLYSVESTRLNGESSLILQAQPWLSGKKVIALTLDLSDGLLYWLVQDNQCIHLYTAVLRGRGAGDATITEFAAWSTSEISQNALMYYSGRLFWINGFRIITAQEIGQRTSVSVSESAKFNQFTIIQTSLKPLPGNFSSTPKVIPDSVQESSFRIEGDTSNFQILWTEPPAVDWGIVFYSVEFSAQSKFLAIEQQSLPMFTVEGLEPYALFNLSVTPYTYWGKGQKTSLSLRTPESVPSAPENPRIFILSCGRYVNKNEVVVEFRWSKPKHANGVLTKFEIIYRISEQSGTNKTTEDWISVNVIPPVMSFQLEAMSPGYIVAFQVRVFTSKGPGPFSDMVVSKTSEIKPFPYLISLLGNKIVFLDMDQKKVLWTFSTEGDISTVGYTADDEMGYFVQGDSLFLLNLHNRSSSKLLQGALVSDVAVTAVDWIARRLYFALKTSQDGTQMFDVDLEHKVKSPRELKICKRHSAIISFSVYPLLSRLYWTEVSDLGHQMFYCSISNHTLHHIVQPKASSPHGRRQCFCNVTESELGGAMTADTSEPKRPRIYFTKGQEIWAMDLEGCQCWKVTMAPAILGKRIASLTVDREFVYWIITTKDNTQIYQAEKGSGAVVSQVKAPGSKHILAYSSALQPLPDKAYLSLASDMVEATILNATNTSLTLKLPPAKTNLTWHGITSPTPTYLVYYTEANNTNSHNRKHRILESQETVAHIEDLRPFSAYVIQVAVKNYYSDPLGHLPLGKEIQGKTTSGVPGAVCHINATVLSDTSLHVIWTESDRPNGPQESVRYQLVMSHLAPIPETPLRQGEFPSARLALLVTKLSGGQLYVLKVLACHSEEMWCTESHPVTVNMFDTPEKPSALVPDNSSLRLNWKAPSNVNLTRFWFELQKWKYNEFYHVEASCSQGPVYVCNIADLQPYTPYNVRVVVVYTTGENSSSSPESFKTKAGVPSKPGIPKLLEGSKNSIQWEKAEDNGSRLMYYILEIRKGISNDSQNQSLRWKMVFNGSCNSLCTWKSKNLRGTFQFRAVAANNIGFGEYSGISEDITLVEDGFWITETSFVLAVIVGIFLVATVSLTFVWYRSMKNRKISKEGLSVLNEDDKELAELRGLEAGVGLANACYAVHTLPTQEEIENLPAFPREKLSLRLLLGSGAFGEVYEGTAVDILGVGSGEIKVAVKTLKKGSTDQEKIEFLKEAHLMSKFNHPNILKQLGVCLLSEPQYIILELMEGGDLLSYLRKARGTTFHGPLLTLVDLVEVCVDISKGCVYLEQMHFIHRDLAARNCLVSVKDYTSPRVVKIGDFGLAREIYKNDYYRKRGEGLLPVRWMAPENLMDGIFTSQSDVWSFGILVWEILTLGHQPYPAHSNLDVLNYVQEGGRLEPPRNCPDDLWNLMSQCWAQEPDQRPTFRNIQDKLQLFRHVSLNNVSQCGEEAYASGVINKGFEGEEDKTVVLNSDDVVPVALMETKNQEGLSYMVLATKCSQGEENPEGPLGPKESLSHGLKKDEKQSHADKDFCQEPQVAFCSPSRSEGLNYVCLTHSGHGDVSD
ncbi:proto-oncogene tyrosine-protein kinase ROS [Cricetulus griseus]|uniref:Proto-oncogene tyrosine-protein kinase ROS n=1 Tax=Cricetulus griseus TaxID=10029 RepID=A0A8C2MPY4_CRIGR|nr:proto-oncogene tyrosine-protein kinase ROS [Cricetulus griseus]XP_027257907.1 proto-oncogene tyrosine-protein kinase ROS [Cricetulus griseus]ERE85531.1 proto-oncogene tyrosine-protein kinase ROS [Cricetulus griseus]